ncbi:multidrug effflux MFS transporter [Blastochloris viridis]|uniref:Bcr/CflA family efflux transporter n=1 Tax=Blastochloris viridis TaxID=1079 RepID=A0A0H5BFL7_BLAVI|nr:multidrug effflux MFS transporter [Blastochloris viridis]ALK10864.1 Inner membrane transport protein YdhC [Blastochloris viridis]BAR99161.1 multidrug resistance transporter [Blastochloris viridis]CUU43526.1 Inner membrane transport protein ydhC [Blastochloris viridis]
MPIRPDTVASTVLLALLTSLAALSTDMYLPSLPSIAGELAAAASDVQLTLSAFLVGFALGQVVYGPLSDRYGRKPVLLAGLAIYVAASAACAMATSVEMLIAARFVQAIGACGPMVIGRAIVRDLYSGARAGQELARMGSIMGLVPAVAPVLGGILEMTFGWRSSFLVMLTYGVAASAAVLLALPETLTRRAPEVPSPLAIARVFGVILRDGGFRGYLGIVVTVYAGLFAWISGSSFVLQGLYGFSQIAFGAAFSVGVLGYVAGTVIATRLNPAIGIDRTVGLGTAASALGGVAMLAVVLTPIEAPMLIVAAMVIYMLGFGLSFPSAIAGALIPFPDRAGAASSLVGFAQMTFGAVVGVWIGHSLGATALPMAATIAGSGLAAAATWRLTRADRIHERG